MLKVVLMPIMLLSSVQKVADYDQYYTHNYWNYATVHKSYNNLLVSTFNA